VHLIIYSLRQEITEPFTDLSRLSLILPEAMDRWIIAVIIDMEVAKLVPLVHQKNEILFI
jgi:hypothetical protein